MVLNTTYIESLHIIKYIVVGPLMGVTELWDLVGLRLGS